MIHFCRCGSVQGFLRTVGGLELDLCIFGTGQCNSICENFTLYNLRNNIISDGSMRRLLVHLYWSICVFQNFSGKSRLPLNFIVPLCAEGLANLFSRLRIVISQKLCAFNRKKKGEKTGEEQFVVSFLGLADMRVTLFRSVCWKFHLW